jgi:membrane protease YdiL (CAAX protease family)
MPEDLNVTPAALAALVVELGLMIAGLWLLWRHVYSAEARANREPPRIAVWAVTLFDFLMFIWYIVLCWLIFQLTGHWLAGQLTTDESMARLFAGLAGQLGLLAGVGAFHRLRPARPTFDFSDPAPEAAQPLPFAAGLVTFLITLPVVFGTAIIWQRLLQLAGLPVEQQSLVDVFAGAKSPALIGLLMLFAVVVAPIAEELVFRRGFFRFARQHLPRWAALLVPAACFAALHVNWSTLDGLAQFAPLVVLAMVFSLAYERTGSIAVTMIAHGIFNLNSVFLVFAGVNG